MVWGTTKVNVAIPNHLALKNCPIGPDGLILQPDLHGPAITDALQEALGGK